MQDPLYREIILDHWENPQNYGVIDNADFEVTEFNPLCGDEIRLTGKIEKNKLIDVAFESSGCAISKASASIFSEKIKGIPLYALKKLTPDDVLEELGISLTPARTKCALLIYNALRTGLKKR